MRNNILQCTTTMHSIIDKMIDDYWLKPMDAPPDWDKTAHIRNAMYHVYTANVFYQDLEKPLEGLLNATFDLLVKLKGEADEKGRDKSE